MRKRVLAIAVALASMFATQQAFAKHSTKNASESKKHHKKREKKKSTASIAAPEEANGSRSSS
jgi:hypothetical protein